MRAAVERVMEAYTLMVSLPREDEPVIRQRVEGYLADKQGDDTTLAVDALRYLRSIDRTDSV
ncbi:hypothetical protein [Bradyrhizobium japonicum]|uniref:Uncharacterized protein n=1 Tax=Bradyrhizobium japonicum TaxID=375 RepID=A0ABV2RL43_BRAJP|nr:hypothetical protein [Bradyrhizobium japonicum]MBR0806816.1 hypothetical protein [Bradyrhizobium japonicum]MBR0916473.1 hypothetical protein [Bradyrhizobium japonicum]MCP1762367.1 hypothetical protein [Bradyrhizobium japonicum]MCP1793947.1 hypothetical protein [Bradyrhizobium japonicum]MCP1806380.1 hypothetical protein [Bradyrhizobium japonicum]